MTEFDCPVVTQCGLLVRPKGRIQGIQIQMSAWRKADQLFIQGETGETKRNQKLAVQKHQNSNKKSESFKNTSKTNITQQAQQKSTFQK